MRYLAVFALLVALCISAETKAKSYIIQCETCNTVNQAAPAATDRGTGTTYVFSLSKNKLWHYRVRLEGGQYVTEPIANEPSMQTLFGIMRKLYLKDSQVFARAAVSVQIDIDKIPGFHNPVLVAQHFRQNGNGGGNGTYYNTWYTNFINAMANEQTRGALHPDLEDLLDLDGGITGISAGGLGISGGVEWDSGNKPALEIRACNSRGDCVRMSGSVSLGWQFVATTSRWGNGTDYPTRESCSDKYTGNGTCTFSFPPGGAAEFRDGLVSAGTTMYGTITSYLRCGYVNGAFDSCVWITELK